MSADSVPAHAAAAAPPLEKADLVAYLESGSKPPEAWRIGTEHEKIGFRLDDLRPLPYDAADGVSVRAFFEKLQEELGWTPIRENGAVIGLSENKAGGASVTLEPGGQIELSGGLMATLHQSCGEIETHLRQAVEIGRSLGVGFLAIGFSPLWSREETPVMPKRRYRIMSSYMPKRGGLGLDMMFRSCTVQVNLDYADEADMVAKYRVAVALQPLATALFANSPFSEGRRNGYHSWRSALWLDTDPDRTGMTPFVFADGMGFERYVDYALDTPMYFIYRDGVYHDVSGCSFRDFMAGDLPDHRGRLPTIADWENHLTTLFPEVRLKRFLEMRGADSGAWRQICALPAFWVGLLYDSAALDGAVEMTRRWSDEDRHLMRETAPKAGLAAPAPEKGRTLRDLAREALALARQGLAARKRCDAFGRDESLFLAMLEEIVEKGRTPAEELLDLYEGPWERDMTAVFSSCAY